MNLVHFPIFVGIQGANHDYSGFSGNTEGFPGADCHSGKIKPGSSKEKQVAVKEGRAAKIINQMNNPVREYHFDSAVEFIHTLLLKTSIKDSDFDSAKFIYRGHKSSEYQLLPTALRDEYKIPIVTRVDAALTLEEDNIHRYIASEFYSLYDFYRIADKNGIPLPEVKIFRQYEKAQSTAKFISQFDQWIPDEILEIAGIAQHHGIPTRLLDWTFDPLVSLYFAAKGNVDEAYDKIVKTRELPKTSNVENLAIWALKASAIDQHSSEPEFPIKIVRAPYSRNPNLAAQRGLFTHWQISTSISDIFEFFKDERIPFDEKLKSISLESGILYKFTIPKSESIRIIRIISKIKYNSSEMFPGLEGVAKEVMDYKKVNMLSKIWPSDLP